MSTFNLGNILCWILHSISYALSQLTVENVGTLFMEIAMEMFTNFLEMFENVCCVKMCIKD